MRIDKSALRADLLSHLTVRPGRADDRARPASPREHDPDHAAPGAANRSSSPAVGGAGPRSAQGPATRPRSSTPAPELPPQTERPVPLSARQVAAADRLYGRLEQWRGGDAALGALVERFPGFDAAGTLLKVVAVGSLYGSAAVNSARFAAHVRKVLTKEARSSAGPELVEQLAAVPPAPGEQRARLHLAFASKFAHFFVNPDRYPIMDTHAVRMVKLHLGRRNRVSDEAHRYLEFVTNFRRLRAMAGLKGPKSELDRYLWLAGRYRQWLKNPSTRVNAELASLFRSTDDQVCAELRALVHTDDTGVAWL